MTSIAVSTSNSEYVTSDTPQFMELFLAKIQEAGDLNEGNEMSYYKVYGKTKMGHLTDKIGEHIPVDGLIVSGTSLYSVWNNLYHYCLAISETIADKCFLPPLDNPFEMSFLLPEDEDLTMMDFIDRFMETFWDNDMVTIGRVTLIKIDML